MDTWILVLALSQPIIIDGFSSYEACRSYGVDQKTCNRPKDSTLNACWRVDFNCIRKPAGSAMTAGPQSKAIIISRNPVD